MTTLERLLEALAAEDLKLDIDPNSHEYLNGLSDPDSHINFLLEQARWHKKYDEENGK